MVQLFQGVFLRIGLEVVEVDVDPWSFDSFLLAEGDVLQVISLDDLMGLQRVIVEIFDAVTEVALLLLVQTQPADEEPAEGSFGRLLLFFLLMVY